MLHRLSTNQMPQFFPSPAQKLSKLSFNKIPIISLRNPLNRVILCEAGPSPTKASVCDQSSLRIVTYPLDYSQCGLSYVCCISDNIQRNITCATHVFHLQVNLLFNNISIMNPTNPLNRVMLCEAGPSPARASVQYGRQASDEINDQ